MPTTADKQISSADSLAKPNAPTSATEKSKAYTLPGRPAELFSSLPYFSYYFVLLGGLLCLYWLKNPYIMLTIIYVVIPIVDSLSEDWLNPDREQYKELEKNMWFALPLTSLVLFDNITTLYGVYFLSTADVPWIYYPGAIVLIGSLAGHQFIVSHELFHRRDVFSKSLGIGTIFKNMYLHYFIDHTQGHHKIVATPEDPSTARYGESIFQFLPRVIKGAYLSAWKIENKRLREIKGVKGKMAILQNKMFWFTLAYFIPPTIAFTYLGLKGLFMYLIVMLLSICILETGNYIEHYGLLRKQIGPGEYEKVNITHSWNAPNRLSNYFLFKAERHSDHHESAYKPYQGLSSFDDSPMLPHGYFFCILLACTPGTWFSVVNRTLLAYKEKRPLTQEEDKLNKQEMNGAIAASGVVFGIFSIVNYFCNQAYYK